MAFIDFTNGEVLTADQMDTVMRQSVMRFADATARDTALSAVLAEGMMCYLDDTNEVLKYDGASWIDISGDITGVTAGTALTGGGTSGNVTLDVDLSAVSIPTSQISDITASASELNTLDGITATTAELNFTDGVTSGIQTQIDGKQDDVITTQGDLVIGDVSGVASRIGIGSADQILVSDGTTATWQDPAGAGGMTLIATQSLTNTTGTLSFTSIPQDYKDLRVYIKHTGTQASDGRLYIRDSNSGTGITVAGVDITGASKSLAFLEYRAQYSPTTTLTFYDYTETELTGFDFVNAYDTSTDNGRNIFGFGKSLGTNAITSLSFQFQFGTTSVSIELYGVS